MLWRARGHHLAAVLHDNPLAGKLCMLCCLDCPRPPKAAAIPQVWSGACRRKQLAKQAEMAARDKEERQRLDTLQKQLRGKDYGYDHRGQVGAWCRC